MMTGSWRIHRVEKRSQLPCAWNVAYWVIFHIRTSTKATRIHKTTTRSVVTYTSGPMVRRNCGKCFPETHWPVSASVFGGWNCRRNETKGGTRVRWGTNAQMDRWNYVYCYIDFLKMLKSIYGILKQTMLIEITIASSAIK